MVFRSVTINTSIVRGKGESGSISIGREVGQNPWNLSWLSPLPNLKYNYSVLFLVLTLKKKTMRHSGYVAAPRSERKKQKLKRIEG